MALFQFPATPKGERPKRLPILPGGDVIRGEDGRAWTVGDRLKLLARLQTKGVLIVDENHALVRKAKAGEASPACARLSDFAMHADGSISGATEWTAYGENAVDGGHYIGLSPVLLYDPRRATVDTLGEVVGIHSLSLVNEPNLELPALNDTELGAQTEPEMTPEDIAAAVNSAISSALPALLKPLQDELAELKAKHAENSVQVPAEPPAVDEAAFALAVNDACERHITAGKLPNDERSRSFFKTQAKDKAALEAANAYYDAAAPIVATTAVGLNDKQTSSGPTLTAEQKKLCADMKWDPKALYPSA